jgi:acyl dehydratase
MRREPVFFDDVGVGTEIPALSKGPITMMDMAKFAAENGDFSPVHYDNKFAMEARGFPAAIVHGLQVITYLSQLLTDWIGPNGALKKFASQVRVPTLAGDTLTMKGKVIRKYTGENENYLECEVWGEKQDGTMVVQGAATVTLPSRR